MERLNGPNNQSWWLDTYRRKADPLHSRPKHHMPARKGEKKEGGGCQKRKDRRTVRERVREEKAVHDQRQRKWENRLVFAPPSLCCEEMREGSRSCVKRKASAIKGWFIGCLLCCDLRVKERLFVEGLLAGNLLHWFHCHIVVARWSVYMLARGIKIKKCFNIYDSITMGLFCVCCVTSPTACFSFQHISCFQLVCCRCFFKSTYCTFKLGTVMMSRCCCRVDY